MIRFNFKRLIGNSIEKINQKYILNLMNVAKNFFKFCGQTFRRSMRSKDLF